MIEGLAVEQFALAANIGSRYIRNAMFVGIGLAALILMLLGGGGPGTLLELFANWPVQAFIILIIGPVIGHGVGAWSGRKIFLQGWSPWLVGPLVGFACVWTTTLLFSLVGYLQEGIHGWDNESAFQDYILNPLLSVTFFGGLFVLITAIVLAALFDRAKRKHFRSRS